MKYFMISTAIFLFSCAQSSEKIETHQENITIQKLHKINDPLYSTFMEYNSTGNNLEINNQKFKALIDNSTISTNYRKMNYKIENEYLTINEKGDNKIYYFLKANDYLKKYSEFEPKEVVYNNKIVFESNSVIKPEFNYTENFEEFLRKNIPSYTSISATNNFFKAKFVLTKENKITDIQIEEGISKTFDTEFKIALLKSEKFIKNPFGRDLLVTQTFNFFKIFAGLTNKDEKKIYNYIQKGNSFYEKNEFNNAITNYEMLLSILIKPEMKERFGFALDQAFINLGVSYLATGNNIKSCESFLKVGNLTNFKVRNYLTNFCQ